MKFTIMSGELAAAVAWVSHALPRRAAAVPVLNGILLHAGDFGGGECLQLSAFDYDTSRRISVELDAPIDDGRALLPGRLLGDVVKMFPKGELVDVAVDDSEAVIRCGRSEYVLTLMPVDDYPSLPKTPAAVGAVESKLFAAGVAQAASAAGTDDTLPMLTGVRWEIGEDGLIHLAATDRYRMTWRTLSWTPAIDDAPSEVGVLVPAKVLADVARGLPDGPVQVAFDGGLAAFTADGRTVTVRLLDGAFPDFRSHFAKQANAGTAASFDAGALAKAVKRVAVMAERSAPVRLTFTQDGVLIEAGGGDVGRGSEQADCELDGGDITIAFNPPFLLAALNAFAGPVQLRMNTATTPAVLSVPGDESYRHLIMPIRLPQ